MQKMVLSVFCWIFLVCGFCSGGEMVPYAYTNVVYGYVVAQPAQTVLYGPVVTYGQYVWTAPVNQTAVVPVAVPVVVPVYQAYQVVPQYLVPVHNYYLRPYYRY